MYEAKLEANLDFKASDLKKYTVVMPISLGAASDQNEKNKMKANFKEIQKRFKKLVIVPADLLQADSLKAEYPEKNDQELLLEAFYLGVSWLKELSSEILKISIPFKIIPWHQVIYNDFSNEKVHELFVEDIGETLDNIQAWSQRVAKKLEQPNSLTPNKGYLNYLQKVTELNTEDKSFTGAVTTSINFFKERAKKRKKTSTIISNNCQNAPLTIEQNSKDQGSVDKIDQAYTDYTLKESAVYWMWGEQGIFNCSAYPAELNPAIRHIQEKFLDEKLFNLKFKYQSIKKIISDDDDMLLSKQLKPTRKQSRSAPDRLESKGKFIYDGNQVIEKETKSAGTTPRNNSPESMLKPLPGLGFFDKGLSLNDLVQAVSLTNPTTQKIFFGVALDRVKPVTQPEIVVQDYQDYSDTTSSLNNSPR